MLRRKSATPDGNIFELVTPFAPAGDQPEAIRSLVDGVKDGAASQVLMGATGSGKNLYDGKRHRSDWEAYSCTFT